MRWLRRLVGEGIPPGFFSNVGWQSLASVGTTGVAFLYAIVVGRALGASDYGLIALGLSVASITFQLVELRLHEGVIRYVAEFWERRDAERTLAMVKLSLLVNLATAGIALLLVVALAPWVERRFMHDPRGATVMALTGAATFSNNVATATALGLLRVFGQFRTQAAVQTGGAVMRLLVTALALWGLGWGVMGVLVVLVVTNLLTSLTLLGVALGHFRSRLPVSWGTAPLALLRPRLGEIGRFVRSTYLVSLSSIPTKELDVAVLGRFAPLDAVGVYRIAKNFMVALWTLSDAAFLVVYPELARMWARREARAIRAFVRRLTGVMGVFGLALVAGSLLLVPPVIRLLLGVEFLPAARLFGWMVWGLLFWAPLVWVNPLLMAAGRPDLTLRASVVGGIAVAALYFVTIPPFGATGAALVYALATPVVMLLALWMARRHRVMAGPAAQEAPG